MVIARTSSRWTSRLFAQSAQATRSSRNWRPAQRRTYAGEGGHSSQQSSMLAGDLPWAIASLAVTLPSVYYLMQPQIERFQHPEKHGHGGHGGHGEHGEHGEEGEGGEQSDSSEGEESEEGKSEDQGEGGETDEGNPDDSGSEDGEKDTPGTSEDEDSKNTIHEKEGGQDVEGVQFKGATREGEQGDTRKHIPDAKGFSKKRIESDYGGKEGEAQKPEQDPSNEDMAAASKPAGDKTTQSGKQEGLSNTDTKHSINITDNPEKSTKGEGGPETAKNKGTVDPQRPQV